LTGERRSHVRAVADAIMEIQETALTGWEVDESVVTGLDVRQVIADPFGFLGRLIGIQEQAALGLSAVGKAVSLSLDEMFYLRAYMRAALKSARTPMLLRALFVTAIGTVEPLVTRLLLLLLYHASPQAFSSLAAPELEDKARKLCSGSPGRWREALVDDLGAATVAGAVDHGPRA
jgi:hypothetical protein